MLWSWKFSLAVLKICTKRDSVHTMKFEYLHSTYSLCFLNIASKHNWIEEKNFVYSLNSQALGVENVYEILLAPKNENRV